MGGKPRQTRRIEYMDLDAIKGAKKNPKTHDINVIRASYQRFSAQDSPVLDERTKRLLSGHGRIEALRALRDAGEDPPEGIHGDDAGWLVPIQRGGRTKNDSEAHAYVLAANKTTEIGGWDSDQLTEVLASITNFEGIGFEMGDAEKPAPEDDDVPDPLKVPTTKASDIWILGEHRLMCGSSNEHGDVMKLIADNSASCMWTDPPYGVDYENRAKPSKTRTSKVANDKPEDIPDLLDGAFGLADEYVLAPGASIYIAHPSGAIAYQFETATKKVGWRIKCGLVWVKSSMVISRWDYHPRHEPILYCFKPHDGGGRHGRFGKNTHGWHGADNATTVFEIDKPTVHKDHPTIKPVALVVPMLLNSTARLDWVYDPFAGSSTTIIACEKIERRCLAMELDPIYCDVSVCRWQEFTGEAATLEATGETFESLSEARVRHAIKG